MFSNNFIILDPLIEKTFISSKHNFSTEEIRLIRKFALDSSYDFPNYEWPTNTYSKKVNQFFKILNAKKFDSQYMKTYILLLDICPELIHEEEGC